MNTVIYFLLGLIGGYAIGIYHDANMLAAAAFVGVMVIIGIQESAKGED